MISWNNFLKTFKYMQLFWEGLVCTVSLSALSVVAGFILALVLATMRLAKFKPLRFVATTYVELFRATPMMVQLFLIYHVALAGVSLPTFKLFGFIRFERFIPGVIALSLNSGAYLCEIVRSGIQSVDLGQTEAARILPAIANEFVTIIKESSIAWTIGVQDIMGAVNSVTAATFSMAEPLIVATCIYFCLTFPTSKVIQHFERKMSRGDKR